MPPSTLLHAPTRAGEVQENAVTDMLSSRQTAVLLKAIEGKPNKVVARELNIAEGTVKAHLAIAYRALGVHNRTEAVFAAAKLGLHKYPITNK